MNEEDIRAQLEAEYDRVIKETLQKLYWSKPLNRAKITAALMAANKAYWTARLVLLDNDAVYAAGRVSGALAMSYYYAAEDLAEQVQHVYAGYRSAFHLSQKGAKELLDKVVYDRPIAESLQRIADAMPVGEERNRILAEISAPAYRYRMQRAEQIAKNAQEACENIARGEIAIDRQFLQTEIEKAYNISLDGALSEPPSGEIADMLSGDVVLDRPVPAQPLEMPRADVPVQDFTPTDDRGIMDSFSVVSTDHAREIMENRWSGESFSERIWNNTDDLAQEVKQVILEGELTGASEAKMAAKIRDRFTVGMHEARRVVRTEHNYCINQAELKGMKDAGFDEYEFASLGENADDVCHTCDDLDGERFKIEDAVVGVNCPPMHPFCRCKATTPMETKEDVQADIDRLLDGRSIEDIERELDRQIAEKEEAERLMSAAMSGENSQNSLTTADNGGIIETKAEVPVDRPDNEPEYLKQFDRYDVSSRTDAEKLAQVNPNYVAGRDGVWENNCQRCVAAYEAVERGYDVTALAYSNDAVGDNVVSLWKFSDPMWTHDKDLVAVENLNDFQSKLNQAFSKWGDGARVMVSVHWDTRHGGGAHGFIAKQIDGVIHYIDPQQNRERDINNVLSKCTTTKCSTWFMRIDNREFSDLVALAMKNRE